MTAPGQLTDDTDLYDDDGGSDGERRWEPPPAWDGQQPPPERVEPQIQASLSEPTVSLAPERPRQPRATDTHRRPNPWEYANRKTFKPIITIGKSGSAAPSAFERKRQPLSLSFNSQKRQPPRPERAVAPTPLYAGSAETLAAYRCGTLCVGAAIDVREVYGHYTSLGLQCTAYKDGLNVVVHCLHVNSDEDYDSHAFYFMYGSLVLWNMNAREEHRLISETVRLFSRGTVQEPEVDDFGYIYVPPNEAKSHIHKDVIHLTTSDVMEKLAVSFGLAQSAKLSVFERTTESTIAHTRHIPEQLAASGKISLSRCAHGGRRRGGVWLCGRARARVQACGSGRGRGRQGASEEGMAVGWVDVGGASADGSAGEMPSGLGSLELHAAQRCPALPPRAGSSPHRHPLRRAMAA
jgi:hypothetical protein